MVKRNWFPFKIICPCIYMFTFGLIYKVGLIFITRILSPVLGKFSFLFFTLRFIVFY